MWMTSPLSASIQLRPRPCGACGSLGSTLSPTCRSEIGRSSDEEPSLVTTCNDSWLVSPSNKQKKQPMKSRCG